jgi:hypothetical protein
LGGGAHMQVVGSRNYRLLILDLWVPACTSSHMVILAITYYSAIQHQRPGEGGNFQKFHDCDQVRGYQALNTLLKFSPLYLAT